MSKKLLILSADDDRDDQELIEEALKKTKFEHELKKVQDGSKLINFLQEKANTSDNHPDIIFIDLNMPVQDGRKTIEILKSERSSYKNIPLVVLTTSSAAEDITFCYKYGANLFLVKPHSF